MFARVAVLPSPLAGLLLALPALEGTGLLEAARQVYGRLKDLVHELGPEVSDARGMITPGGQRCREPETGQ